MDSTTPLGLTVSVADYARRLRVGENKVRGWIEQGDLLAIDVSDSRKEKKPRWRIPVEEIERFEGERSSLRTARPDGDEGSGKGSEC